MNKLLVDAPSGVQELIQVGDGGSYFDPARVLWDERVDGPLPAITLGGMVRGGSGLIFSQSKLSATAAVIAAKSIPTVVPMAAARKALRGRGIKDAQVKGIISSSTMTAEQKEDALIDWEYQPFVRRNSPLVAAFGPALGLTEGQIDELFITADAAQIAT